MKLKIPLWLLGGCVVGLLLWAGSKLAAPVKPVERVVVITNYPKLKPGLAINFVNDDDSALVFSVRRFPLSNNGPFTVTNTEIFTTNEPVVFHSFVQSNGWVIRFK